MQFKLNDPRTEEELMKAAMELEDKEPCYANSIDEDDVLGFTLFVEFECMINGHTGTKSFLRDFRRCTRLVKQFFPHARLMQDPA